MANKISLLLIVVDIVFSVAKINFYVDTNLSLALFFEGIVKNISP